MRVKKEKEEAVEDLSRPMHFGFRIFDAEKCSRRRTDTKRGGRSPFSSSISRQYLRLGRRSAGGIDGRGTSIIRQTRENV